jgi:mannose-6-phosphate isomerase-like protein (cupin superfamily)
VAFENGGRGLHQQVWMLDGTMHITVGTTRHRLAKGDCLAMDLDQPTMFHNPRAERRATPSWSRRSPRDGR